jgi:hypothetical protein
MIDPGYNETVAIADINRDGRPDIVSGEAWYEAPSWTKHRIRDINFANGYIDNFSDLIFDVDGDGYPDIVHLSIHKHPFARTRAACSGPRAKNGHHFTCLRPYYAPLGS